MVCDFTFDHYEHILNQALGFGYKFYTCEQYLHSKLSDGIDDRTFVMRHDVDEQPQKALKMANIERSLGIQSTYFFRVFNNNYNIFGYETLNIIQSIKNMGHEIGYHAEPIDVSMAVDLTPDEAFYMGKRALELVLGCQVAGAASHHEATGYNNLDYFTMKRVKDLGLEYEAYDEDDFNLFKNSNYITDGYEWYWRCFQNGVRTEDRSCLCAHVERKLPTIYALTHPNSWYEAHYHLRNVKW